jgi:glucosamine--fructose-6-phosphate aminotransferase (isomerizing)
VLPLFAGPERAVAATKTYTAQLMALAMLSAALRGEAESWQELELVPELVARAIELGLPGVAAAERFAGHERLIVLGRGYNLSTAFEITLKVKETSGVMADGYSSADFLHGPKAIADRSLPILLVASGHAFADLDGVVGLAKEKGAPLIAIAERPEILAAAEMAIPLPAGTPEWLSPVVAVVPGQLFALGLSLARGFNPDVPPGLSKVTQTM